MRYLSIRCALLMLTFWLAGLSVMAQDTIKISLPEAEKQFLKRNLYLIAEKFNIDKAKAEVIQAKLFDNPEFSAAVDIYNPDNNKWFDATKETGQYAFSLEQIIRLGKKRNKQIELAKIGVQLSENQFYDLLRTLRFSLNSIFYETYYTLRSLNAFDVQTVLLEELQQTYQELETRGIAPLSDVVRIRSLLYSIKSDQLELKRQFNEKQAQIQLLLQNNEVIYIPVIDESEFTFSDPNDLFLPQLINEAKENRVDLQQTKNELAFHKKNLSLQKATAIPDVTIGADYDKRGNFTDNLFNLTMSVDLPLFNRNQGNIRAAKAMVTQGEIILEQKQNEIENEVQKTYYNALDAEKVNKSINSKFESDLDKLLQSITDNFRKKNINMLEFTDFYESYRDNIIKINQIRNQKAQVMEELRFVIGNSPESSVN